MSTLLDTRRYLTSFDSRRMSNTLTDVLVVGSGVAGARAAIESASHVDVILMCKGRFDDCATRFAQGGIAAAKDPADVGRHLQDTMRVGFGLNRREAVEILVREGPARLLELIDWGIELDRENGSLSFTREGGHSVKRIVHAQGDRTGEELARTLQRRVRQSPRLRVFEQCFLIDFLSVDGECRGAVTYHPKYGHQLIWAKLTILASGGCGQIWRETTNPPVCTGDGYAAAFRAGARLRDMEFVQFHPTTLYVAGAGRTLISEAVRGEGAYLIDRAGKRFMLDHHPDGELAPRDIVSRVIHEHLAETHSNAVFLDVRHLPNFARRFPGITGLCAEFKIDVRRDLIPVRPSAHYMIGGVEVTLAGESSFPGLLACGEAACTGVHGANRMASNSLLEGLVFGKIVGENAAQRARSMAVPGVSDIVSDNPESPRTALDLADIRNSLASVMWRNVGIVRSGDRLRETGEILDFWGHYTLDKTFDDAAGWEMQNKLTVARIIAMCALARSESIGVHYRRDAASDAAGNYHTTIERNAEGTAAKRAETWPG